MSDFWQVAVSVAGLGGIGCFVFWSLMKRIVPITQAHPLNQRQTFLVTVLSLVCVSFSLISILVTYYFMQKDKNRLQNELVVLQREKIQSEIQSYKSNIEMLHQSNLNISNMFKLAISSIQPLTLGDFRDSGFEHERYQEALDITVKKLNEDYDRLVNSIANNQWNTAAVARAQYNKSVNEIASQMINTARSIEIPFDGDGRRKANLEEEVVRLSHELSRATNQGFEGGPM